MQALANALQDTTSWNKPRTLETLPGFLEKFSGNSTKLWSASKKNGAPHTIIVTAAGLRAAEIARFLPKNPCLSSPELNIHTERSGSFRRRMPQLPNSLRNTSNYRILSNF